MPVAEYESRTDSVLAWKKAQKLGRFDPNAPTIEQQKILASEREVEERGKLLVLISHTPHRKNLIPSLATAMAYNGRNKYVSCGYDHNPSACMYGAQSLLMPQIQLEVDCCRPMAPLSAQLYINTGGRCLILQSRLDIVRSIIPMEIPHHDGPAFTVF